MSAPDEAWYYRHKRGQYRRRTDVRIGKPRKGTGEPDFETRAMELEEAGTPEGRAALEEMARNYRAAIDNRDKNPFYPWNTCNGCT